MLYHNPFKINDRVVCAEDKPGSISQQSTLQKNKVYIVIAVYKDGIMVNDGTTGFWFASRFKRYVQTWSEKMLADILTNAKKEELLTKKLNWN